MAPRLTPDEVRRIAALARLAVDDADVERLSEQLSRILDYASEVSGIDTSDVPPMSHPLGVEPAWRDDAAITSIDRGAVFDNAPDAARDAGLFRVPKVL